MIFPSRRRFEFSYGVVKFLAVGAQDGLDDDIPAAIRAARHPRAITAFRTFEEIRAAHKLIAESQLEALFKDGWLSPPSLRSGAAVFTLRLYSE